MKPEMQTVHKVTNTQSAWKIKMLTKTGHSTDLLTMSCLDKSKLGIFSLGI